jgi:uncharacterized protein (TIGR02145 family)
VNNTPDQAFTTQVGDTIIVSLRVAYMTTEEDTILDIIDTTWHPTAEVDEIYTIRANPWLSLSDTSVCMIHYADMHVDFNEHDAPSIQWRYRIDDEATYTTITSPFDFFAGYRGSYDMGGNISYEDARFGDFDKTFDTLHLIVSLTTGNPTCPIAHDTALLTLMSAHTLTLQTIGTAVQDICYNDTIVPIEYIFGNGADSVEVTWDITPSAIDIEVVGNSLWFSGTAEVGTYTYTVRTTGICETVSATGSITVYPLPVLTVTGQGPSCQDREDGMVSVTVPGGADSLSLYRYRWFSPDGEQVTTNPRFVRAGVGMYTIEVTRRSTGCVSVDSIELFAPDTVVTADLVPIDAFCYGTATGSLEVIPRLGSGVYDITLYNNQTQAVVGDTLGVISYNPVLFEHLAVGEYRLDIQDGQCGFITLVTINEPTLLTASITDTTAISCKESADGTATVTISGGTAPYDIVWRDTAGAVVATDTVVLTNMNPDVLYTVTVSDDHHCGPVTDSIKLWAPDSIVETFNDIACNSYVWNNQTYTSSGTYSQRFTSQSGCDSTVYLNLTILYTQLGEMWDYACVPSYTWALNGETYLVSGDYVDTIVGGAANGCDSIVTLHLLLPQQALSITSNVDSVSCHGYANGVIRIKGLDGIPMQQFGDAHYIAELYSISDLQTPLFTDTIVANVEHIYTDLPSGNYVVRLYDSICSYEDTLTVHDKDLLVADIISSQNLTCYGSSDGSVEASPIGGTPPYTYNWTNSDQMFICTTAVANALPADTYSILITDKHGCTATNSITLSQPDSVKSYITDYACYDYTWTGATNVTYTQSGVYAHTYVGATADGCDSTVFLSLTIYHPVYDTTKIKLCGGDNGSTYVWTTPENVSRTLTVEGVYYDTVYNHVGCDSLIHVLDLIIPTDTIVITKQLTPVTCYNVGDGIFSLSVTGGNTPYTFALSTGESESSVNASQVVEFRNLIAGSYTVTVVDTAGCMAFVTDTIVQPDTLTIAEVAGMHQDALCYQTATGSSRVVAVGGNGDYTYVWTDTSHTVVSQADTAANLMAGTYHVVGTDAKGCSASMDIVIDEPAEIATSFVHVACDSFKWVGGTDSTYYANDTVSHIYTSQNGCDSTVTMYLYIGSSGSAFPANCPDDTINIAPYGVCTMNASEVHFPAPTFDSWLQPYVDTMYHNGPAVYHVDSIYTITWTVEYHCGVPDTCVQHVTISYPPCGFENGSMYTATDADGNVYNTVRIGCDCWLAENLKSTHYSDTACMTANTPISVALAYYAELYPDTAANVATYGRLYSWYSAVGLPEGSQDAPCVNSENHVPGACPAGWYLPSDAQYQALYAYGLTHLMATYGWLYGNGTNSTGFTALPGGYYNAAADAYFNLIGNAYFWTTQQTTNVDALNCEMTYSCPDAIINSSSRHNGYSIRCIKERD